MHYVCFFSENTKMDVFKKLKRVMRYEILQEGSYAFWSCSQWKRNEYIVSVPRDGGTVSFSIRRIVALFSFGFSENS